MCVGEERKDTIRDRIAKVRECVWGEEREGGGLCNLLM